MKIRPLSSLAALLTIIASFAQQQPLFDVYKEYTDSGQESFEEIKSLILENYYYSGLTENDLYWASVEGMLRHISPPESPDLAQLWTDEEYEKILNSLRGVKVSLGFGSTFNSNDGSLTVTSITEGSRAEEKLLLQDRIVRIDGEVLKGKTLDEVNGLLDGELGESSELKVVRDIEIFDVTLVRDSLKTKNLVVTRIPNRNMALIEIKSFSVGMAKELDTHLNTLQKERIQSLILDLRNNAGGVLNEGINIARLFMNDREIVLRTQARSNGVQNYIATENKFTNFKLVVLVNENTASASEIVASALKDHNRAFLVGKKTYGKGVIETTYTLKNNYRVKFISNAMYSPKGFSWQSGGLLPDYFVDQSQSVYSNMTKLPIEDRISRDLHIGTAIKVLSQ